MLLSTSVPGGRRVLPKIDWLKPSPSMVSLCPTARIRKTGSRARTVRRTGRAAALRNGLEVPLTHNASEAKSAWLRWPDHDLTPWVVFNQQSALCLGYPVHRSLPPTRRSSSDEILLPGEA
jgi:hypothetical protein